MTIYRHFIEWLADFLDIDTEEYLKRPAKVYCEECQYVGLDYFGCFTEWCAFKKEDTSHGQRIVPVKCSELNAHNDCPLWRRISRKCASFRSFFKPGVAE